MRIVDTHCHASTVWYEPLELLRFQMHRCGVDRAVLVQIYGQYDNSYQRDCVESGSGSLASVVAVDVQRPDACGQLETLAAAGAVGLRLAANDRSPGADPLAIWRTAERLALPVSVALAGRMGCKSDSEREEFTELITALPALPIVIEHLGGPHPPFDEREHRIREHSFGLSRFPNVYMKFGGVAEIARKTASFENGAIYRGPIPPYHMKAYETFGPERLMWGSNYPPVSFLEGYERALSSARERFAGIPRADQELIFGGVAERLYFSRSAAR
jgi:L-fuconolactonase